MTHWDTAEKERTHRFCEEAHALLRRSAAMPLRHLQEAPIVWGEGDAVHNISVATAAVQRALRLLEYAMADTEPEPYGRRSTDKLT